MPVIFQEKIDRKFKLETPAWQNDIIVATNGNPLQHFNDLDHILKLLENAGYRASSEKSNLFKKEIDCLGCNISEKGIKPKIAKTEAILAIEPPKKLKEIRSFLGSVQYLGKFIPNLTDKKPLRKLLEKANTNWTYGKGASGFRPN